MPTIATSLLSVPAPEVSCRGLLLSRPSTRESVCRVEQLRHRVGRAGTIVVLAAAGRLSFTSLVLLIHDAIAAHLAALPASYSPLLLLSLLLHLLVSRACQTNDLLTNQELANLEGGQDTCIPSNAACLCIARLLQLVYHGASILL